MDSNITPLKVSLYKFKVTLQRRLTLQNGLHYLNGLGHQKKCYVCGKTFHHFTKYPDTQDGSLPLSQKLQMVGSDSKNYGCPFCRSHDRERHLFMYFDKLDLWEKMQKAHILHFAPERNLPVKIKDQTPKIYILGDLVPKKEGLVKLDATNITFPDNYFDLLIANHILEHIPDYLKALSEFFRVLKPGGIAILQTPFSKLLKTNFEDVNINNDSLRKFFHGLEDHVRTFSRHHLLLDLKNSGFSLELKSHAELFTENQTHYYGVNADEELIQVIKPKI